MMTMKSEYFVSISIRPDELEKMVEQGFNELERTIGGHAILEEGVFATSSRARYASEGIPLSPRVVWREGKEYKQITFHLNQEAGVRGIEGIRELYTQLSHKLESGLISLRVKDYKEITYFMSLCCVTVTDADLGFKIIRKDSA
jgi:hypothetical protein